MASSSKNRPSMLTRGSYVPWSSRFMSAKSSTDKCYYENTSTVKCYNYNEKGHLARLCPKPRIQGDGDSENDEQDNNVHDQKNGKFELLIRTVQLEAEKINKVIKVVNEENALLQKKLEKYKERV
ncbi:retrovirus-related pol polyprotein from transposon TNT 1-94 [Tanacetum coccineum]